MKSFSIGKKVKKLLLITIVVLSAISFAADTLPCNDADSICQAKKAIHQYASKVASHLEDQKLKQLFINAYFLSVYTTFHYNELDGSSFIITGGWQCYGPPPDTRPDNQPDGRMEAMWIRDAAAQLHSYLSILSDQSIDTKYRDAVSKIIAGFIQSASIDLKSNPTAHAFGINHEVMEKDYEAETPAYLLWISYEYWHTLGRKDLPFIGSPDFKNAVSQIIKLYQSTLNPKLNLVSTGYRPSDDKVVYPYNLPINMFVAHSLRDIAQMPIDHNLASQALELSQTIDKGIEAAVRIYPKTSKSIFPFEVGGEPNQAYFADDANIPGLLSIPYLNPEYSTGKYKDIYANTRAFVLSSDNPFYFKSAKYKGIGSPHIAIYTSNHLLHKTNVWPLGMISSGISGDSNNAINMINQLVSSAVSVNQLAYGCQNWNDSRFPAENILHESFSVNSPSFYTRGWFAWPNAYFAEWIDSALRKCELKGGNCNNIGEIIQANNGMF